MSLVRVQLPEPHFTPSCKRAVFLWISKDFYSSIILVVKRAVFRALSNCIIKKVRNLTFFLVRVSFDCLVNQKTAQLGGGFYGMSLVGPRNRNVASRRLGNPSNCLINLAPPIPQPPCGGIPYRKHSRYHCNPSWCNPFSRSCSHSFSYDSSRWAQVTISTPRYSKSADTDIGCPCSPMAFL